MLDRKKIMDMRLALARSGGGLLDSTELRELLASGGVLSELLDLADASLMVREEYLAMPEKRAALATLARLGGSALRAMVVLDMLEEVRRGPTPADQEKSRS
jgi:hypothetical protein